MHTKPKRSFVPKGVAIMLCFVLFISQYVIMTSAADSENKATSENISALGTARDATVSSFGELLDTINAVSDGGTETIILGDDIIVTETINIPTNKTINIVNLTNYDVNIIRDSSFTGSLFSVASGGSLYFYESTGSLTVSGNGVAVDPGAKKGALIHCEGSLYINGGTFTNSNVSYEVDSDHTGNVRSNILITGSSASFTMDGGSITGNSVKNLSNGDSAYAYGGGVALITGASMTLSGGEISHNQVSSAAGYGIGGGICLFNSSLVMTNDGAIHDNYSEWLGGGIAMMLFGSTTDIYGGYIYNNICDNLGGGIYVDGYPGVSSHLNLFNSIITENTASSDGGGLWDCSYGSAYIYDYSGSSIYKNAAEYSGDDIQFSEGTSGSYAQLSNSILGGGNVTWYNDYGTETDQTQRYKNTTSPVEMPTTVDLSKDSGYHSEVSEEDVEYGEQYGKVFIYGNSAVYGGGIANNGLANFGRDDLPDNVELQVKKEWNDSDNVYGTRPSSVIVYLVIDGIRQENIYITLNEANGWTDSFGKFDSKDAAGNKIEYTIEEEIPDGYEVKYDSRYDLDGEKYIFTITNSLLGKVTLIKVDYDDDNILLAGAKFILYRDNAGTIEYYYIDTNGNTGWTSNSYFAETLTTNTMGQIEVEGLQYGSYTLEELKAPDGYDLPDKTTYEFMISVADQYQIIRIPNNKTEPSSSEPSSSEPSSSESSSEPSSSEPSSSEPSSSEPSSSEPSSSEPSSSEPSSSEPSSSEPSSSEPSSSEPSSSEPSSSEPSSSEPSSSEPSSSDPSSSDLSSSNPSSSSSTKPTSKTPSTGEAETLLLSLLCVAALCTVAVLIMRKRKN